MTAVAAAKERSVLITKPDYWIEKRLPLVVQEVKNAAYNGETTYFEQTPMRLEPTYVCLGGGSLLDRLKGLFPGCWFKFQEMWEEYNDLVGYGLLIGWDAAEESRHGEKHWVNDTTAGGLMGYEDDSPSGAGGLCGTDDDW